MATITDLSAGRPDIQRLCQLYLKENTKEPVAQVKENINFQVLRYKLKPISDTPSGFLGRHQFLRVEIVIRDGQGQEEIKKLRFFTKSAPHEIASRMEYLEEFGVFKKEILVYRDILPHIQQIFGEVAPKCYYGDNDLLVFEDLASRGFRMGAGRDGLLDFEHLNCLLKALAAMHAGSIAYEVRAGKSLPELYGAALEENAYPSDKPVGHVRMQNFHNAVLVLKEFLKELPHYREHLDLILEELPKRMAIIFELAKVSTKYRNVFSHADLWANNIMFQYDQYGKRPLQCRFVDFQLARYAPPLLDLVTVLTIPTTRAFRTQHLSDLMRNYYRFMGDFLQRAGLSLQDFMDEEQFQMAAEEFRICGLIESCLFSHLTILPAELAENLTSSTDGFKDFFSQKRVEICLTAFRTDQVYRERLTDMLEDLVDNFILNQRN